MWVYLNDQIIDAQQAQISVFDRGFLLADGIFDTFLIVNGQPVLWELHLRRLLSTCETLSIAVPPSLKHAKTIVTELLEQNDFTGRGQIIGRITITRGLGERGLPPPQHKKVTFFISLSRAPAPLRALNIVTSDKYRVAKNDAMSRFKTLSYSKNILARLEAEQREADEILLGNSGDHFAGASAANLFIVRNNALKTPALNEGALDGVVRRQLLENCEKLNLKPEETALSLDELLQADLVFLTNSAHGLMDVRSINGKDIPVDQALLAKCRQFYPYFPE